MCRRRESRDALVRLSTVMEITRVLRGFGYGLSQYDRGTGRGTSFRLLFPDFESYRHQSFGGMNCTTCSAGGWWYGRVLACALDELSAMTALRLCL
jgi:hypothetical protein